MNRKIALAQINTVLGGLEQNTEKHLAWIERAKNENAELVVFPELSLTGYFLQDFTLEAAIRPEESQYFSRLQTASQQIDVMFGFVEVDARSRFYISSAYLSRGEVLHIHRKVYLPSYTIFDDKRFFTPGEQVRAFDTRFGRVGMLICEDYWHVSMPYLLWLDGADLFLCQAASPGYGLSTDPYLGTMQQVETILSSYAGLLTAYFASTNRVGYEDGLYFPGGSVLVDPGGTVRQRAGAEEGITLVEIDPGQLRRKRFRLPLLRDERPELVQRELARILGAGT